MERLEKIFLNPDEEKEKEIFKCSVRPSMTGTVIKPEQVPESYLELQKQVARERGVAVEEISEDVRETK